MSYVLSGYGFFNVPDLFNKGSPEFSKHRDPFLFSIYVRVKKKADLSAVKGEIFKELEKAGNELISETKLREIQSKIRYSFAMALDKPLRVGFSLSGFLSLTGNPHTLNEYYATLEKVAPEEVRATAKRIFSGTNRTVVTLSHGEKK